MLGITEVKNTGEGLMVKGGQINATTAMPDRIGTGTWEPVRGAEY